MALILVTGASTGLGLDTAIELAREGHAVVVHARTSDRVAPDPDGGGWEGSVVGDLSDLDSTRDVAQQANEFGRFYAVIHNAGTVRSSEVAAVNIVAPYVLTALIEKPARLVYLSSSMHRSGSMDLDRLASRRASYSDTKLWVTALSHAVAHRWAGTTSQAVDPGWVPTRMGGAAAPDDLGEGHRTQTWLATEPDVVPRTGGYWHHRRTESPHPAVTDFEFQTRLLAVLEQRTGIPLGGR